MAGCGPIRTEFSHSLRRQRNLKTGNCLFHYANQRQYGNCNDIALNWTSKIYRSLQNADHTELNSGIFNLEFSSTGKILVAACENTNITLFDAYNRRKLKNMERAHEDSVNCIRFLSDNTFATGSDDECVNIWDIRNLNKYIKTLRAHTDWVKSLDFCEKDNFLITSGFDGSVIRWDLNNYTSESCDFERLFNVNGLGRTCLSPDGTKFFLSTTAGYNLIIHDVDFDTLANDLNYFKPNLYRIMQLTRLPLAYAAEYSHLFEVSRKKNRLEFIVDFPDNNEAEVVSSIKVHPHGHSLISRNMSRNNKSEWTCVHHLAELRAQDQKTYAVATFRNTGQRAINVPVSMLPTLSGHLHEEDSINDDNAIYFPINVNFTHNSVRYMLRACCSATPALDMKIYANKDRLSFYIEESSVGIGYIKEISVSKDGLIICSPNNKTCRLLAYGSNCEEMYVKSGDRPKKLKVIAKTGEHSNYVLTSKFSPVDYTLVTGCLQGKLLWHSWQRER